MTSIQDISNWVEIFNQTTPYENDEATEVYIACLLKYYEESFHNMPVCPSRSQDLWNSTNNIAAKNIS